MPKWPALLRRTFRLRRLRPGRDTLAIGVIKELMNGRMYPTTLNGLERATKLLAK